MYRTYVERIKLLALEYSTNWQDTVFDLKTILVKILSVLASWEPAFSLKTNS